MTCKDCETKQENSPIAYYRWDTANIALKGCDKHLREVFKVLNFWQDASRKGKLGLLLHPESWQNLFGCIRKSKINSKGNFWAAIQEIERQFEELKKAGETKYTDPIPADIDPEYEAAKADLTP